MHYTYVVTDLRVSFNQDHLPMITESLNANTDLQRMNKKYLANGQGGGGGMDKAWWLRCQGFPLDSILESSRQIKH